MFQEFGSKNGGGGGGGAGEDNNFVKEKDI